MLVCVRKCVMEGPGHLGLSGACRYQCQCYCQCECQCQCVCGSVLWRGLIFWACLGCVFMGLNVDECECECECSVSVCDCGC